MTDDPPAPLVGERIAWGRRKRLEFIEFRLLWDGRINRSDLSVAFEMSDQQASADIAAYDGAAPGNLVYDVRERAYLRGPSFTPRFIEGLTDRFLLQLTAIISQQIPKSETYFGKLLPSKVAALPHQPTRWETVMWMARAIRQKREIQIEYASLNPKSKRVRRIAPHAFGYGSGRWHARAWSRERNDFRDFTFDRITGVTDAGPSEIDPTWDRAWYVDFPLIIVPNPELLPEIQKTIAAERRMTRGKLVWNLPIALCFYLIADLNLDLAEKVRWGDGEGKSVSPRRLPLILQNWSDYKEAEKWARSETSKLLEAADRI